MTTSFSHRCLGGKVLIALHTILILTHSTLNPSKTLPTQSTKLQVIIKMKGTVAFAAALAGTASAGVYKMPYVAIVAMSTSTSLPLWR